MSEPEYNLQRIELTLFDPKLSRDKAEWPGGERPTVLYCTRYQDAVAPPFPAEGKKGISVWVGSLEALKEPKARLLWELEKRRKRPTVLVLTGQKGRSFMRATREIGSVLSDSAITPMSFLRRRGKEWDSLDFFSAGDSPFMEGANPRLKRLKQSGWESMVDRAAMIDPAIKEEYFQSLHIEREQLIAAASVGFRKLELAPLVGVAGECLTQDSLYSLFEEPLLRGILQGVEGPTPATLGEWLLLTHRAGGAEVLFMGRGTGPMQAGKILVAGTARSEFAVAEVKQALAPTGSGADELHFSWVKVDWRYPPDREIPTVWREKSASASRL